MASINTAARTLLAVCLLMGHVPANGIASRERTGQLAADAHFRAIYTSEYRWRRKLDAAATPSGLPDVSRTNQAAKLIRWSRVSRQLRAIPPSALSEIARIDYAVYNGQIDALLAQQRYRDYEKPLNSDSSFWGDVLESARADFRTEQDYRHYIALLRDIPRYFEQQITNMRAGLARGFTPPRVTLEGRDIGVAEVAEAKSVEDSPFYAPVRTFPASVPAASQDALRQEAGGAIRESVVPAYATLLQFLRQEYVPGARTTLAAYDLPDGKAYYRSKIREFVTVDRDPQEIHALGLAEVAKIRARMLQVMSEAGFSGDLPAFLHYLRSDPRFYASSPQELLEHAAWIAKNFDGKAAQWFGHLPRSRFAIKPVPAELAPFYTGGRGGPGIYLVNTYNLPARPLYSMVALTLHESAPGHAFQMSLAAENDALPSFRRDAYLSAYGEGWALYAEALGEEMGMYETPYDRFGMLSYQMWRAARLVVDTGIHVKGWTREQARQYLHANTALAEDEIRTEVDRYIAWPAQALSYYIGELAFQQARAKAQASLGTKFNIRAFHDTLLALGSVPLPVIETRTEDFIKRGGKGPYPREE